MEIYAETRLEVIERIITKHLECLHELIQNYSDDDYYHLMAEKEEHLRKIII